MNTLLTLKPGQKSGIRMSVNLYEAIKGEIVTILGNTEDVNAQFLFDVLHGLFIEMLGENTGWYIYHVKLDLEARGVIRVERSKRRNIGTLIKMAPPKPRYKSRFTNI